MSFTSLINRSRGVTRVTLAESDIETDDFSAICIGLSEQIKDVNVVLDLSALSGMTSQEFDRVNQLCHLLTLFGRDVIVCGIGEVEAMLAVTFDVLIKFRTAQNFDHAITQF